MGSLKSHGFKIVWNFKGELVVRTFFLNARNQQKFQKKICKQPELKKIGVCDEVTFNDGPPLFKVSTYNW